MSVRLSPDRLSAVTRTIYERNKMGITLRELLDDPGEHSEVWEAIQYLITGERTYSSEGERRFADMLSRYMGD